MKKYKEYDNYLKQLDEYIKQVENFNQAFKTKKSTEKFINNMIKKELQKQKKLNIKFDKDLK
jgi:inosine/xanthosine triphosphate pyrophosphatase family protein